MSGIVNRMPRRRVGASVAVLVAVVASVGLSGCSSEGDSALPPVIVELDQVDGSTVEVRKGGTIDLVGDDQTYTAWTAEISDPEVVEFEPGHDDGSAQFNPGLIGTEVGESDVTLENTATGDTVSFTVEVTRR